MQSPSLHPEVANLAPSGPALTVYDEEHAVTYMRMLDADAEGADSREVSRIVLHVDPERDPDRARGHSTVISRGPTKWASSIGYWQLLGREWPSRSQ